ncbi:MAG: hypothetical protein ACT4QD_17170 [Acidobacteriota bacterium]
MRRIRFIALLAFMAVPLAAQTPEGWMVRVDRSTNASDPDDNPNLKFVTMGKGLHVTGGPAGTFWNPKNTATGNFTAKATFALQKPSGHVNYYGLIFGGADLGAATQNYIYFLVAQNGTFVIRHRAGDEVHDVQTRTANAAIAQPGADGKSVNALEVRISADAITYTVNGTVVHKTPKSGLTAKTDGIVGLRVNHLLDVHIDGFEVTKS